MNRYRCWYRLTTTVLAANYKTSIEQLPLTHAPVHELNAPDKEKAFRRMEAGGWTPVMRRYMEKQIGTRGVSHLSMTVGDVIEDVESGEFWFCAPFSWEVLATY